MGLEQKNVLVTGGAGFIGSHLVDGYLKTNINRLIVLDNFSTGNDNNLSHIKDKRLKVIRGDVLDFDFLDKIIKKNKTDMINHLAAELEVYTGIKNVLHDANINIVGTLNVLRTALENKVEKVIFASSGAVYGQARYTPEDENHPIFPHWPYGVSKLAAEKYCRQFWELNGLPTVAFRYGIVYGPREWFGRVLTMFIKRAVIDKKPLIIFGDGKQTRDYVYVEDVVKAHILAANNDKIGGEFFNLGSGKGISIEDLAKKVLKISNSNVDIVYDDPKEGESSEHQPGRIRLVGELKDFVLDSKKAERILGWKPETKFDYGIKKEIEWVRKNPDAWKTKPRV